MRSHYRSPPPAPPGPRWPRVARAAYVLGRIIRRRGPSRRALAAFVAGLLLGSVASWCVVRPARRCHLLRDGSGVVLVVDDAWALDREVAYLPRVDEAFDLARRVGCEVAP